MTEFKAVHDDSAKIFALKQRFNKALEQIRHELWKKSQENARLRRKRKELSKEV